MNTPITVRGYTYPSVIEAWRAEAPPSLSIKQVYRRHKNLGWDLETAITQGIRGKKIEQLELFQ